MKEQLHKLMEAEGMSPAKFADEIGVQRSSISHIVSGRNKPSYDFIMKIMDRFKGINAEWLLTGQGSMIKGQESSYNGASKHDNLFNLSNSDKTDTINASETNVMSTSLNREDNINEEKTKIPNVSGAGNKTEISQFTNVNNVKYILVFYKDGSFEQHNPRE